MKESVQRIEELFNGNCNGIKEDFLIDNEKLGELLVRCDFKNDLGYFIVNLNVYEQASEKGENLDVPMATSKLRIAKDYACVEKVYVGRKFRRQGIGSSLVKIMEDLTSISGDKRAMFAIKSFSLNDEDIRKIRKEHGEPTTLKGKFDNFLSNKHQRHDELIVHEFFKEMGYYGEKFNNYDFPKKFKLVKNGYLVSDNDESLKVHRLDERIADCNEM
jgi:GNAT superfamily N-acetyltransferase